MSAIVSAGCCCGEDLPTCQQMFLGCECHQQVRVDAMYQLVWQLYADGQYFQGYRPGGNPCPVQPPPCRCPCTPPRMLSSGQVRWSMEGIANRVLGNCGNGFVGTTAQWDAAASLQVYGRQPAACCDNSAPDDCADVSCLRYQYSMNGEGTLSHPQLLQVGCNLTDCAGAGESMSYWASVGHQTAPGLLFGNGVVNWCNDEALVAPVRGSIGMSMTKRKTYACGMQHRCPTGPYGGCAQHPAAVSAGASWGAAICERCGEQDEQWSPLHGLLNPALGRYCNGAATGRPNYCSTALNAMHRFEWTLTSDACCWGTHVVGEEQMYLVVTPVP
jgi:hypothetical protein